MNDAPIAAEMPVKPTLAELAKSAPTTPAPRESPPPVAEKPPAPEDARHVLQEIAAGPEKQKVDSILSQGSQLLLDAGDRRAQILALARQVSETPIGVELRRDVVQMITEMNPTKLTPEGKTQLTQLKKDIESLNMPKTDPSRSEFAKFLENYNKEFPDKAVDATEIEAIRTNKQESAQAIARVFQGDTVLSAKLWEQMKGDKLEAPDVHTPEAMLKAAGLEASADNIAKAHKIFEPADTKEPMTMGDAVMPTIMITALLAILVSQLASTEGGGGGHQ